MTPHLHSHAQPHPSTVSDRWGQVLSLVCLVHCVATPVVLMLAPALAGLLGGWHPVLLAGVVLTAGWAFVPGYRFHRDKGVLVLGATGVTLLAVGTLLFHASFAAETALTMTGASAMLLAHWRNQKRSKACPV